VGKRAILLEGRKDFQGERKRHTFHYARESDWKVKYTWGGMARRSQKARILTGKGGREVKEGAFCHGCREKNASFERVDEGKKGVSRPRRRRRHRDVRTVEKQGRSNGKGRDVMVSGRGG